MVAFGSHDSLYRLGCDNYVYKKTINDWEKLGKNKASWISASNDALWIVEYDTDMPYKFD